MATRRINPMRAIVLKFENGTPVAACFYIGNIARRCQRNEYASAVERRDAVAASADLVDANDRPPNRRALLLAMPT